jgi:hypothetical protein|tara:strand:+ start:1350 stop:1571 length:222 start_codon:yes stop_codon:yes gene_type:complete
MNTKEYQNCIGLKQDLITIRKAIEEYFKGNKGYGKMSKGDKMLAEAHLLLLKQLTYNGILTNIPDKDLVKKER